MTKPATSEKTRDKKTGRKSTKGANKPKKKRSAGSRKPTGDSYFVAQLASRARRDKIAAPTSFTQLKSKELAAYLDEDQVHDVERAFKDKAFTSKNYEWQLEPVHGRTILQMEGRDHSVHRNLIAPAFRGSELTAKFVPVIEQNARELIDGFRSTGS